MSFDPSRDIPDLSGKVVLVTGGKGIGGATVKLLAEHNARRIYVCARSRSSADALIESIAGTHPNVEVIFYPIDLSSLESVKKYAAEFVKANDRLDLLFLNSGISTTGPALTEEGYQSQFGINHLGHALLTQLLMPTMLRTLRGHKDADVRIMVTSSAAHRDVWGKGFDADNVRDANAYGSALTRYGHSKLANVLFARGLAQHYPDITSTSYHPGVVKTEIWSKDEGNPWIMAFFRPFVAMLGRSVEDGARTGLFLATQKVAENGAYYEPVGVKKAGSKWGRDPEEAEKCWIWTEKELRLYNGGIGWPKAY